MRVVLVPWPEAVPAGPLPADLRIDVYPGGPLPAGVAADVEFFTVPYAQPADPAVLGALPRLQVVQSLNAGVEGLVPLLPPGVVLCNGRGLHDASVAEHALGLIVAAQRDLARWVRQQDAGRWERVFTGSLADRRVAIVGYGSIGVALERRLLACEASVVRVARRARPADDVYPVEALPRLLPDIDVVVLVLPENPGTVGLFGADLLAALPDGALVVNVGRGRTLDTAALLAETATGRLRAALDVTDPEPLPPDHPLWHAPGVLITPHVAGGSAAFYPRAQRFVADQVRRFAAGQPLRNVWVA
jgi:phosphoglycerate dehydrogenase-like enzyme